MPLLRRSSADQAPTGGARGSAARSAPPPREKRFRQFVTAFRLTRRRDPRMLPLVIGAFLAPLIVLTLVGVFVGPLVLLVILGVLVGALAGMVVFSRRAQAAAYAEVGDQPGVAAGVVESMRGDWRVTPAVQVNRSQDLVHRVVGRAGVVLLVESRSARGALDLLAAEKKRVRRVIGEVAVHDVFVGDGDGEVPLRRLQTHIAKLPRALTKAQVAMVDQRLRSLGGPSMPIPKGMDPTRRPPRTRQR